MKAGGSRLVRLLFGLIVALSISTTGCTGLYRQDELAKAEFSLETDLSSINASWPLGTTNQIRIYKISAGQPAQMLQAQELEWEISGDPVLTVTSAGTFRAQGRGAARIRAALQNPANQKKVFVEISVRVSEAAPLRLRVSPLVGGIPQGSFRNLQATMTYTDNTTRDVTSQASWISSQPSIANFSAGNPGRLTASNSSLGLINVRATLGGLTADLNGVRVAAAELLSPLRITPSSVAQPWTLAEIPFQAEAIFTNSSGQYVNLTSQVTWQSQNSAVLRFDPVRLNVARAQGAGSTEVLVSYAGAPPVYVNVVIRPEQLLSIDVNPAAASVPAGQRVPLRALGRFSNGTTSDITSGVAWRSRQTDVALVSNAPGSPGVVTGIRPGNAEIMASAVRNLIALSAPGSLERPAEVVESARAVVTVTPAVLTGITIAPLVGPVYVEDVRPLSATGHFSDGTSVPFTDRVVWNSTVGAVAQVSNAPGSEGQLVALGEGVTRIEAVEMGNGTSPKTGRLDVTVLRRAPSLVNVFLDPFTASVRAGTSQRFHFIGAYSDGSSRELTAEAQWQSSDPSVAALEENGLFKTLKPGRVTITATEPGQRRSAQAALVVLATTPQLTSIQINPERGAVRVGQAIVFTAKGTFDDQSTQDISTKVEWGVSDRELATIEASGIARGLKAGRLGVMAKEPGSGLVAQATLEVQNREPNELKLVSIELVPPLGNSGQVEAGKLIHYQAIGKFSDGRAEPLREGIWRSEKPEVAASEGGGAFKGVKEGEARVSFSTGAAGANEKAVVTGYALLKVTAAGKTLVAIELSPLDAVLEIDETETFNATGVYQDGSRRNLTHEAAWASADAQVAKPLGSGAFRAGEKPGRTELSATLDGITGRASVTVQDVALAWIEIAPPEASVAAGELQAFTALGIYTNGSRRDLTSAVQWTADDESVAKADEARPGTFIGIQAGKTAKITARMSSHREGAIRSVLDGMSFVSAYSGGDVTGHAKLQVTSARLLRVEILPLGSLSVAKGNSLRLTARGYYGDGSVRDVTSQLVWTSDRPGVLSASAMQPGMITGVSVGAAVLQLADRESTWGSRLVQVTPAVPRQLAFAENAATIAKGDRYSAQVLATLSDGSIDDVTAKVIFSTEDRGIASVGAATGICQGLGAGVAKIVAELPDVDLPSVSMALTVKEVDPTRLEIQPDRGALAVGEKRKFKAYARGGDGSRVDVTALAIWKSDNREILSISNAKENEGHAVALKSGETKISAEYAVPGGEKVAAEVVTRVTERGIESSSETGSEPGDEK